MEYKAVLQKKKESDDEFVVRLAEEMSTFFKDIKVEDAGWGYEVSFYKKRPLYLLRRNNNEAEKKIGF